MVLFFGATLLWVASKDEPSNTGHALSGLALVSILIDVFYAPVAVCLFARIKQPPLTLTLTLTLTLAREWHCAGVFDTPRAEDQVSQPVDCHSQAWHADGSSVDCSEAHSSSIRLFASPWSHCRERCTFGLFVPAL